jgi:glutathione S-transferase
MSGLTLVIGNRNYSSWSMRPWLLMRQLGIEFEEIQIPLHQPDSLERKLAYSPAGKVPILIDGDMRIWDSLAIVEHRQVRPGLNWVGRTGNRKSGRSVEFPRRSGIVACLRPVCVPQPDF